MEFKRIENRLIILLSRVNIIDDKKKEIESILDQEIDWGYFILNCYFNKVSNIVYHNIIKLKLEKKIRFQLLKLLRTNYYYTSIRLGILKKEFSCIVKELNKNEIKYAILKGFALVEKAYQPTDIFMREFNDIDILVEHDDLSKISHVLCDLGYIQGDFKLVDNSIKIASRSEKVEIKLKSHQIYPYVKKVDVVSSVNSYEASEIDINFTIFEGGNIKPRISTHELLKNIEKIYLDDDTYFYCLDNYYMLIQLAYHLYKETKYEVMKNALTDLTMQKFCDIREFILQNIEEFDLKYFVNLVNESNLNNEIYFVLYFTYTIYEDKELLNILSSIKEPSDIFIKQLNKYEKVFENGLFKNSFNCSDA